MYSVLIFCPVPKISNSLTFFNFNTIDLTQRKMCAEAMSILTATDDNERVDAGRTPSFIHANSHQHARLFVELTKKIGICGSLFITTMRILVFLAMRPTRHPISILYPCPKLLRVSKVIISARLENTSRLIKAKNI
jgi:hypothetical protein